MEATWSAAAGEDAINRTIMHAERERFSLSSRYRQFAHCVETAVDIALVFMRGRTSEKTTTENEQLLKYAHAP